MVEVIVAVISAAVTLLGAWLVHRQVMAKERTARDLAMANTYGQMQQDLQSHIKFMKQLMQDEREEHQRTHETVMARLKRCQDDLKDCNGERGRPHNPRNQ